MFQTKRYAAPPTRRTTSASTVAVLDRPSAEAGPRATTGRLWPLLGPAFVTAVAYVDPGNFATNIAAGSIYGYLLVWVVIASNLMAMLIQYLSLIHI